MSISSQNVHQQSKCPSAVAVSISSQNVHQQCPSAVKMSISSVHQQCPSAVKTSSTKHPTTKSNSAHGLVDQQAAIQASAHYSVVQCIRRGMAKLVCNAVTSTAGSASSVHTLSPATPPSASAPALGAPAAAQPPCQLRPARMLAAS